MPDAFQQIGKASDIAVDIGHGIFQRVPYPCLGGQVAHDIYRVVSKQCGEVLPVFQIKLDKLEPLSILVPGEDLVIRKTIIGGDAQFGKPAIFQPDVIVAIDIVQAQHLMAQSQ